MKENTVENSPNKIEVLRTSFTAYAVKLAGEGVLEKTPFLDFLQAIGDRDFARKVTYADGRFTKCLADFLEHNVKMYAADLSRMQAEETAMPDDVQAIKDQKELIILAEAALAAYRAIPHESSEE